MCLKLSIDFSPNIDDVNSQYSQQLWKESFLSLCKQNVDFTQVELFSIEYRRQLDCFSVIQHWVFPTVGINMCNTFVTPTHKTCLFGNCHTGILFLHSLYNEQHHWCVIAFDFKHYKSHYINNWQLLYNYEQLSTLW